MKIAFLISAYTDPKQLGNMVEALADGDHWFFIHVDRKVDITPFRDSVKRYKQAQFVTNRFTSNWGGYGQVRYQLEMLRCAIESGIAFERVFILTAQDYPLIGKRRLWGLLQGDPKREYLIGYGIKGCKSQLECATVYHFFRDAPEWLRLRKVARRMMQALPIRKKPYLTVDGERWQLYKSSSYMCITFGLARYIYNKVRENKDISRYFRYAFVPEELLIPTVVFTLLTRNTPQPLLQRLIRD